MKKLKNYLIELTLVILGVFIAIWVDSIREDLKSKGIAKSYIKLILSDLEKDTEELRLNLKYDSSIISNLNQLKNKITSKNYSNIDSLTINLAVDTEFKSVVTGYSLLINSDVASLVDIEELELMTSYYKTGISYLEHAQSVDRDNVKNLLPFFFKYQSKFELLISSDKDKMIKSELTNYIFGKILTTTNELNAKQNMLKKAEDLKNRLNNYLRE